MRMMDETLSVLRLHIGMSLAGSPIPQILAGQRHLKLRFFPQKNGGQAT
jgi:hypothetical protein